MQHISEVLVDVVDEITKRCTGEVDPRRGGGEVGETNELTIEGLQEQLRVANKAYDLMFRDFGGRIRALEADKARLDWLEHHKSVGFGSHPVLGEPSSYVYSGFVVPEYYSPERKEGWTTAEWEHDSLREAIDAAMAGEGE